jgi:uncharacterized protein
MNNDMQRATETMSARCIDQKNVIFISETGSTASGTTNGSDDLDYTAIRVESWGEFVNGQEDRKSLFIRTKPDGVRSGPGDIDIQVHTLRKFSRLLASANPSILMSAFSPRIYYSSGSVERILTLLLDKSRSRKSNDAFPGFMRSQLKALVSGSGKKVNRPELIEKYGYDTKYASRVVRLGFQGEEYLLTGRITMPMPPEQAEVVMSIENGLVLEDDALVLAESAFLRVSNASDKSNLPASPDKDAIREALSDFYAQWYAEHPMTDEYPTT